MLTLRCLKRIGVASAVLGLAVLIFTWIRWASGMPQGFEAPTLNPYSILLIELLVVGIVSGFIGALMGLGGGIILIPMLTSVFNIPIHKAIAISIVGVIATSISGGSAYFEQRMTNIRLAMFLETSTSLGAFTGALLALVMPGGLLYFVFSIFAFYVVFSQIRSLRVEGGKLSVEGFKRVHPDVVSKYFNLSGEYFDEGERVNVEYVVKGSLIGWLTSFIAGVGSGLLGIGGGFIKVSAMNLFMSVPLKAAIATSKFMIGVTAATSAAIYYACGVIMLDLVAPIAIGTIVGASIGTSIMNKLRVKLLKVFFTAIVCYLGYIMLRKGLLILGVVLP